MSPKTRFSVEAESILLNRSTITDHPLGAIGFAGPIAAHACIRGQRNNWGFFLLRYSASAPHSQSFRIVTFIHISPPQSAITAATSSDAVQPQ